MKKLNLTLLVIFSLCLLGCENSELTSSTMTAIISFTKHAIVELHGRHTHWNL